MPTQSIIAVAGPAYVEYLAVEFGRQHVTIGFHVASDKEALYAARLDTSRDISIAETMAGFHGCESEQWRISQAAACRMRLCLACPA